MKKINLLILFLGVCLGVVAQEAQDTEVPKDWKWSGVVGLNASVTGLVNWSAGGNNNVAGLAFSKIRCLYSKNDLSWDTNLDLEFGLSYIDQKYDNFQKTSDKINFSTKFGWQFKKSWYLAASAGFLSQFAIGQKYPGDGTDGDIVSKWLAPSYTDISVGIDWKPNDIFSVYLSPVVGKITTAYISDAINDDYADQYVLEAGGLRRFLQETYGVWKYNDDNEKEYKTAKAELGFTAKGVINYAYKDLKVITSLTLFTPYAWDKVKLYDYQVDSELKTFTKKQMEENNYSFEEARFVGYRDNNRRVGNFDVNWDLALSYQLLKVLNITFTTSLKYVNGVKIADKHGNNPVERVQFLGTLGVGVGYSF